MFKNQLEHRPMLGPTMSENCGNVGSKHSFDPPNHILLMDQNHNRAVSMYYYISIRMYALISPSQVLHIPCCKYCFITPSALSSPSW